MNDDARRLIDDYLDGELAPEAEKRLLEWLAADPEHVRAFVREAHLHRSLRDLLTAQKIQSSFRAEGSPVPRKPRRTRLPDRAGRPWIVWGTAAAGLLALAGFLIYAASRPRASESPTARQVQPDPPEAPPSPDVERDPVPPPAEAERAEPRREPDAPPPPDRTPAGSPPAPGPKVPPAEPPVRPPPGPPPEAVPGGRTVALVAEIHDLHGTVLILKEEGRQPARPGQPLVPGEGVSTEGAGSSVSVRLPDGTRMDLGADTRVRGISERPGGGRTVALETGTLEAEVARQPADRPLVFATPQAEARVIGTRLTLFVTAESTRLEVRQGRMRLTRLKDRASVDVPAGHHATAAPGSPLASRPLPRLQVVHSFQDGVAPTPAYAGTRDATLSDGAPASNFGREDTVRADGSDKRARLAALLKWDLSEIPPGSRVVSAQIDFFIVNSSKGRAYTLHEVRHPWDEQEASWTAGTGKIPWQFPGARGPLDRGAPALATLAPLAEGEHAILLNDLGLQVVQAWINAPSINHGFIIVDAANTDGVDFCSREASAAARRPKLTVTCLPPERR